jgi:hypothetical protein
MSKNKIPLIFGAIAVIFQLTLHHKISIETFVVSTIFLIGIVFLEYKNKIH